MDGAWRCVFARHIRSSICRGRGLRGGFHVEDGTVWAPRRISADVPEPFDGFRDVVREMVHSVVVSWKPDHAKAGALHEATAYGFVRNEKEAAEIGNLVYRKPLVDLTLKDIGNVRDPRLRADLQALAKPYLNDKGKIKDKDAEKALKAQLADFSHKRNIRRIRIGKPEKSVVPIRDRRNGKVYKALIPGDNHHIDIVQMRDGTWQGFAATVFEVNQKGWRPEWERKRLGGKLVMRLHKGDMIEVDDNGKRQIMVVHRLSPSNNVLYLAAHHEGGELAKRHNDSDDLFRWDFANIGKLKHRNARKVIVDEIGRLRYARSNIRTNSEDN